MAAGQFVSLFLFVVIPLLFLMVIVLLINIKKRIEKIETKLNHMPPIEQGRDKGDTSSS
ncbi:hypothetical protein HBHAL_4371 [Halobacillus halophilus DSM 2266]|uniref:Uncharacterized protein n=1 Tax=Halobacillus halophilus (strain ATCC 35676 / DSM 2266 / JCM 20832 / KCTC 3685 / LMG 17431 / NBRC 102448 / NCIMB 2269) TaxID=866895 RepID=I0JRE2_HALH3|nr:hypothetical protein [Halobacillus halophilus]CCG46712.1 hypothetical protein HBHAL_4371 [Halobacillus halophilus DSM 2266]